MVGLAAFALLSVRLLSFSGTCESIITKLFVYLQASKRKAEEEDKILHRFHHGYGPEK